MQFNDSPNSKSSLFINNVMSCEIIEKLKIMVILFKCCHNLNQVLVDILERIEQIKLHFDFGALFAEIQIIIGHYFLIILFESQL